MRIPVVENIQRAVHYTRLMWQIKALPHTPDCDCGRPLYQQIEQMPYQISHSLHTALITTSDR